MHTLWGKCRWQGLAPQLFMHTLCLFRVLALIVRALVPDCLAFRCPPPLLQGA